jgi:Flp pilus assembly protein TadG
MALVYLTLSLVVLLGMAAVVIDTGYMYMIKAQLQNAADAGALAGGAALDHTNSGTQAPARAAARNFAQQNSAAGEAVNLDLNYGNSANGDIVVGCWNAEAAPQQTDITTSCGRPNAIKINARRSRSAGTGPNAVKTVFARIFSINEMNVGAVAIAYRPPEQTDKTILVK